jgi:hypothetical protein
MFQADFPTITATPCNAIRAVRQAMACGTARIVEENPGG